MNEAKTLRVFFVIHQRKAGTTNYAKIRTHQDFSDSTPNEAAESIYKKHGQFAMCPRTNRAPDEWAEIHSHTYIDPHREKVVLESEKTYEVPLFDALTLKACLQDSPDLKAKKFKKGPF